VGEAEVLQVHVSVRFQLVDDDRGLAVIGEGGEVAWADAFDNIQHHLVKLPPVLVSLDGVGVDDVNEGADVAGV